MDDKKSAVNHPPFHPFFGDAFQLGFYVKTSAARHGYALEPLYFDVSSAPRRKANRTAGARQEDADLFEIKLGHFLSLAPACRFAFALAIGGHWPLAPATLPVFMRPNGRFDITGFASYAHNRQASILHHVKPSGPAKRLSYEPAVLTGLTLSPDAAGYLILAQTYLALKGDARALTWTHSTDKSAALPARMGGASFAAGIYEGTKQLYQFADQSLALIDWGVRLAYDEARMMVNAHARAPQGLYQGQANYVVKLVCLGSELDRALLAGKNEGLGVFIRAHSADDSFVAFALNQLRLSDFKIVKQAKTGLFETHLTLVSDNQEGKMNIYFGTRADG